MNTTVVCDTKDYQLVPKLKLHDTLHQHAQLPRNLHCATAKITLQIT